MKAAVHSLQRREREYWGLADGRELFVAIDGNRQRWSFRVALNNKTARVGSFPTKALCVEAGMEALEQINTSSVPPKYPPRQPEPAMHIKDKAATPMLKECPWCGPDGRITIVSTRPDCHWCACEACDCSAATGNTAIEAAELWNKRAPITFIP